MMRFSSQRSGAAALAVCIFALAGSVGSAGSKSERHEIARWIDAAGEQGMLAESIAKSACFLMAGIDAINQARRAADAVSAFEEAITFVELGHEALKLPEQTQIEVHEGLEKVATIWTTFGPASRQVIAGDLQTVPFRQLMELNIPLMAETNEIIGTVVSSQDGNADQWGGLVRTTSVAAHQRALSQKAAKEICFLALGVDERAMRAGLHESVEAFEQSLDVLEQGRAGTLQPGPVVLDQLDTIRVLWDQMTPIFLSVMAGEVPSSTDLAIVGALNEHVLDGTDQLVELYIQLHDES